MPRLAIKELERKHGDLNKVIPPLVNMIGQVGASKQLNISPATINAWLKANHYKKVIYYVKEPAL